MLGILGLCRSLDDRTAQAARKAYGNAVDFGAALFQNIERFGHVPKLDTDFFQDGVGVVFDQLQAFFVEHLETGDPACYIGCAGGCRRRRAACLASAPTTSAACRSFAFTHCRLLLMLSRNCMIKQASIVLDAISG